MASAQNATLSPAVAQGACGVKYDFASTVSFVSMYSKVTKETVGCGRGLLDNLRGECGVVHDWKCDYSVLNGGDAAWNGTAPYTATYYLPLQVNAKCVQRAVFKAEGIDMSCRYKGNMSPGW